jgi:PTH2 family peptidyl-tRNA hydrolase
MKQVIVVREDLGMPEGKLAAQVAHASVECVLKSDQKLVQAWKKEGMTKIVLGVKDKQHLMLKMNLAKTKKVVCALIEDAGRTFFKEPTVTCLGIGPDTDEKIDEVTSNLKVL